MNRLRAGFIVLLIMNALRLDAGSVGATAPAELVSFERQTDQLIFGVISTGCTRQADFRLKVEEVTETVAKLTLVRIKKDRCRMRPHVKKILLSLNAAGSANLKAGTDNTNTVEMDQSDVKLLANSTLMIGNSFTALKPLARQ